MRRWMMLAVAASLLLATCADPVGPGTGGGPEPDTTRLDVYETMVRHLAGQESIRWTEVVIVRGICADASGPA